MNRDIVKILVQKEKFDQVNSLLPARQVALRIITGFRGNPIRDLAIAGQFSVSGAGEIALSTFPSTLLPHSFQPLIRLFPLSGGEIMLGVGCRQFQTVFGLM